MHILILKNKNPGSFVRILFIDFSSAFNTIQPHLMASKILKLDVNPRLILWIVDFLVSRSQTVRHQAALSSSRSISTGSPQGTVLSPIPFRRWTSTALFPPQIEITLQTEADCDNCDIYHLVVSHICSDLWYKSSWRKTNDSIDLRFSQLKYAATFLRLKSSFMDSCAVVCKRCLFTLDTHFCL